MAFKGAANLTTDGWRKAAKGLDHIEVVTNIRQVIELNYSALYGRSLAILIRLTEFIPF